MSSRVTLLDIARETGVSVSTVHRALNTSNKVKPEVKSRVTNMAVEMGYFRLHETDNKEQFHLAMLCPNNTFYDEVLSGARMAKSRYMPFGIRVDFICSDHYDVGEQSAQLRAMLETEPFPYKGVAITPAHSLLLNPLLNEISSKFARVVTFNNDAMDSGRISFIGEDPTVAAQTAALIYERMLPPGATIAVMSSHLSVASLRERVSQFIKTIHEGGRLKVLGEIEYVDEIASAYSISLQVLESLHPDAIFTNSMLGSIGCAQAIEKTGNAGRVLLVSYDINERIKKYLQNGVILATLTQDPFMQGYQAIHVLARSVLQPGYAPQTIYHTRTDIVMRTNIREHMPELWDEDLQVM
ncbi:hypothetical protein AGMMS49992_17260 [Clostridia bacterium]|nr:hypothetical protein AGMMS49992_17260 [Clostridia bacterium]